MTLEDLEPSRDDPRVLSLCDSICPGVRPFFVPVRPDSQSELFQCFPNVERKVRVAGGAMIYGWGISQVPKIHIEAQFHAVWQSPAGDFVDVTPEALGLSRTLFLRDDTRTYTGTKVPDRRFALGDKKLVERYWVLLDRSQAVLMELLLAGFERGHPAFRQRLGPLQTEIQELKAKLYAA